MLQRTNFSFSSVEEHHHHHHLLDPWAAAGACQSSLSAQQLFSPVNSLSPSSTSSADLFAASSPHPAGVHAARNTPHSQPRAVVGTSQQASHSRLHAAAERSQSASHSHLHAVVEARQKTPPSQDVFAGGRTQHPGGTNAGGSQQPGERPINSTCVVDPLVEFRSAARKQSPATEQRRDVTAAVPVSRWSASPPVLQNASQVFDYVPLVSSHSAPPSSVSQQSTQIATRSSGVQSSALTVVQCCSRQSSRGVPSIEVPFPTQVSLSAPPSTTHIRATECAPRPEGAFGPYTVRCSNQIGHDLLREAICEDSPLHEYVDIIASSLPCMNRESDADHPREDQLSVNPAAPSTQGPTGPDTATAAQLPASASPAGSSSAGVVLDPTHGADSNQMQCSLLRAEVAALQAENAAQQAQLAALQAQLTSERKGAALEAKTCRNMAERLNEAMKKMQQLSTELQEEREQLVQHFRNTGVALQAAHKKLVHACSAAGTTKWATPAEYKSLLASVKKELSQRTVQYKRSMQVCKVTSKLLDNTCTIIDHCGSSLDGMASCCEGAAGKLKNGQQQQRPGTGPETEQGSQAVFLGNSTLELPCSSPHVVEDTADINSCCKMALPKAVSPTRLCGDIKNIDVVVPGEASRAEKTYIGNVPEDATTTPPTSEESTNSLAEEFAQVNLAAAPDTHVPCAVSSVPAYCAGEADAPQWGVAREALQPQGQISKRSAGANVARIAHISPPLAGPGSKSVLGCQEGKAVSRAAATGSFTWSAEVAQCLGKLKELMEASPVQDACALNFPEIVPDAGGLRFVWPDPTAGHGASRVHPAATKYLTVTGQPEAPNMGPGTGSIPDAWFPAYPDLKSRPVSAPIGPSRRVPVEKSEVGTLVQHGAAALRQRGQNSAAACNTAAGPCFRPQVRPVGQQDMAHVYGMRAMDRPMQRTATASVPVQRAAGIGCVEQQLTMPGLMDQQLSMPRLMERESTVPGVMERESTMPGVMEQESTMPGGMDQELSMPGLMERESTAPGVMERESTMPGLMDQELSMPGLMERESTMPALMDQELSMPGLMKGESTAPGPSPRQDQRQGAAQRPLRLPDPTLPGDILPDGSPNRYPPGLPPATITRPLPPSSRAGMMEWPGLLQWVEACDVAAAME